MADPRRIKKREAFEARKQKCMDEWSGGIDTEVKEKSAGDEAVVQTVEEAAEENVLESVEEDVSDAPVESAIEKTLDESGQLRDEDPRPQQNYNSWWVQWRLNNAEARFPAETPSQAAHRVYEELQEANVRETLMPGSGYILPDEMYRILEKYMAAIKNRPA